MVGGEALPVPSICGNNCSYVVEFEGPYLGCTNYTSMVWFNTTNMGNYTMALFDGHLFDPGQNGGLSYNGIHNGTYSTDYYNASTLTPVMANFAAMTDGYNTSVLARNDTISCTFQRAKYTVNNTYVNSVHSRDIVAEPIDKIVNLIPPTHDYIVVVPGITNANGSDWGTAPANWSDYALAYYRDLQHSELIEAMLYYLDGNFTGYAAQTANTTNSTTVPDFMEGIAWSKSLFGQPDVPGKSIHTLIKVPICFLTRISNLER